MDARVVRWQRLLLWGGLLEPAGGPRTARDWVVDTGVFVAAVATGAFVLASTWDRHSDAVAALDIALGAVACAALWQRREHALGVALVAVGLSAVSALATMATLPAVFNAAIRLPFRQLAVVAALAVVATGILPLLYPDVDGHSYVWQVSVGLLLTAVALGWGLFVRAQRELLRGLRERSEDQAREAERLRISREMHDVLAHRLSLLSVHAGAMENAGARLPPEYVETAGVIRESAGLALEELRTVIGLLRAEEAAPLEPPQPTLEAIPALVEESRAAGMAVAFCQHVEGHVGAVAGRTAYRAVQEGLTNARKHAAGHRVTVSVDGDASSLIVELTTFASLARGTAPPPLPGSGTGLVGLSERVGLAGGEVCFGPDSAGNFVLRASVPRSAVA